MVMRLEGNRDVLAQVGAAIRCQRVASSLTLQELARLSGISAGALSLIETDKRDARLSTLAKIARSLNVELSAFFGGPPEPGGDQSTGMDRGYDLSEFE